MTGTATHRRRLGSSARLLLPPPAWTTKQEGRDHFAVNDIVMIRGLTRATELNGALGIIRGRTNGSAQPRWQVDLGVHGAKEVKDTNLVLANWGSTFGGPVRPDQIVTLPRPPSSEGEGSSASEGSEGCSD